MSRALWAFLEGGLAVLVYLWAGLGERRAMFGALFAQVSPFVVALGAVMAGFAAAEKRAEAWLAFLQTDDCAVAGSRAAQGLVTGAVGLLLGGDLFRLCFGTLVLQLGLGFLERTASERDEG